MVNLYFYMFVNGKIRKIIFMYGTKQCFEMTSTYNEKIEL